MFTTVIGSYPLKYEEMGREAVVTSVADQLEAGIDVVSDGQTRYDMIEYFARAIEGYRYDGKSRVTGKVGRGRADLLLEDLEVAKGMAPQVKGIVTGPVTLVFSSLIEAHYHGYRDDRVYLDTAEALLQIALELERTGVAWVQIDEPFLSVGAPANVARRAVELISTNLKIPVALHVCGRVVPIFRELLKWKGLAMLSHAFMGDNNLELLDFPETVSSDRMLGLGCIDTKDNRVEDAEKVADLIQTAMGKLPADRLAIHPDCGLRMLTRDVALGKLKQMSAALARVRNQQT
ncbi:MAG: methionine synthase [Chloroflexota bacterium]